MDEIMLKIDNVSKQYKLGQIGGTTLRDELQRLGAKMRGKEDPTKRIGAKDYNKGETFMALDGVSFEVKKGERVGIIGHNGAGKSTLLKLISRVTAPTGGTIGLNGRVASMLEVGTGFHGELTGRENIYMNGAILGMTKKEIDAKMEDIIEFSECRQFIDTPVKRYSSGMYVKLAFSVAAHLDSEIMIMDEVLAVGDMAFQKKCLSKMKEASTKEERTVLYVSHNMSTIRQLCERCIVLDKGTVVFDGNVEKAIEIYLEHSDVPQDYKIDYRKVPRLQWLKSMNTKIRTLETGFIDKNNICFNRSEKLSFYIRWKNEQNVDSISLRVEILKRDRTPIGATFLYDFYNGTKDNEGYLELELDISVLSPGGYAMTYVFFERDKFGNNNDIDCVHGLFFDVAESDGGVIWSDKSFGNIVFPPILLKSTRG